VEEGSYWEQMNKGSDTTKYLGSIHSDPKIEPSEGKLIRVWGEEE
jgi:hypothetical protein